MLQKIVESKLKSQSLEIAVSNDSTCHIVFENYRAELPDDIADTLVKRFPGFYRIVRNVWKDPVQTALIIRWGGVGDVLLTTPLIRFLFQRGISVDYISSPACAPLLITNPYINALYAIEQNEFTEEQYKKARLKYDAVLNLHLYCEHEEMSCGNRDHRAAIFFRAFDDIDIRSFSENDLKLDFYLTKDEIIVGEIEAGASSTIKCVYVWDTSTQNRNWSYEQHEQVLKELVALGIKPIIISQGKVSTRLSGVRNLSGRHRSIRDAAIIMSACDVIISPDTGLFHIAQALNIPCIGYFGPFPALTRATNSKALSIINQAAQCDKQPCFSYQCAYAGSEKENACLKAKPKEVALEALRIAKKKNAG